MYIYIAIFYIVAGKVENVTITEKHYNNFTITWNAPKMNSCVIGYQIKGNNITTPIYQTATNYTFTIYKPCYKNYLYISALSDTNNIGEAFSLKKEADVSLKGKIFILSATFIYIC